MVKTFISYYKAHKKILILDLISAILVSGIDMLFPIALRSILNDYIPNEQLDMILYIGAGLFLIYMIRMRFSYYIAYNGHMMGAFIERDMRRDLFRKYEELDYDFYDDHQTGVLMAYLTNHLRDISEMSHHVPEDLLISSVMFIGSFIYLSFINLYLTIIIFVVVSLVAIFSIWRRKKMMDARRQVRKVFGELNSRIENSISGIRLTKALNNEEFEVERFASVNEDYAYSAQESYHQMGIYQVGNEFLLAMVNLALLVIGGIFVYFKYIDYVDLFTYYLYISFLTKPINRLVNMTQQIQQGMSGFERFYQVMNIDPSIHSKEDAIELKDPKGKIEFDHVSFTYHGAEESVLSHFDITINPGEKIGLIGETGVGKSTISKLIPRFYDVDEGSIKIDGVDVRDYNVYSLRRSIGHVQQDVFIFHGTIKDNILYGNPLASDEEVVEAAIKAKLHDFIETLPDGYMTLTGEKGIKLSGGQKQRIAIARLFLQKPSMIILDEATSALDNVTERLIQSAFDELAEEKTSIIIAHRLSTIRHADRIILLGKEGILECGNHEELMEKKGLYYHLIQE